MLDIAKKLKELFVRASLKNVHYRNSRYRIRMLYRTRDPWNLSSAKEQHRFRATNQAISEIIGPLDSVLELGCGEGHQSRVLMELTPNLVGTDVSPLAIKRARALCPTATFAVSHAAFGKSLPSNERFTLVTACELLYYIKDVPGLLTEMQSVARWCLVTYYDRHAPVLDPYFARFGGKQTRTITYDDTTWILHCWKCT